MRSITISMLDAATLLGLIRPWSQRRPAARGCKLPPSTSYETADKEHTRCSCKCERRNRARSAYKGYRGRL